MAFKFVFVALLATASFATSYAGVVGAITYAHAPVVAKFANPAVDAVASTQQNVVRSFGGTVSQYSKAVDTPYSSVRKEDTRISNNVYTPAIAKTVTTYASAPVTQTAYAHSTPLASKTLYSTAAVAAAAPSAGIYTEHHETPAAVYATPEHHELSHHEHYHHHHNHENVAAHQAPTAIYTHAEPTVTKTVSYAAPVVNAAPVVKYHHGPAVATATTIYNHGPDASTYRHNAPGIDAYGTSQTVRYSPAEMVSHMSFDGFGTHWGF